MTLLLSILLGMMTTFLLVGIILKLFASKINITRRVVQLENRSLIKHDEDELTGTFSDRVMKPLFKKVEIAFTRITPARIRFREMDRLQASGNPKRISINQWLAFRGISLLFGTAIGTLLYLNISHWFLKILFFVLFVIIGIYFPSVNLNSQIKKRRLQLVKELPDTLDLLNVSVEAGLGFDSALSKIVEKMDGVVGDEFKKVLQDMKMGKMRKEALRNLAKRTQLDELQSFVGAVIQADQLGVSLINVLRIQSDDIRERRKQLAEERAMKAPIKILFPLIIFIFPSLFIIILGPAMINILNTLIK